ncbi:MAG: DedA family protein [Gemmatimonadales bacterium]|nr:MAG: DedA family protein [Gemmatimonadales bacterium]
MTTSMSRACAEGGGESMTASLPELVQSWGPALLFLLAFVETSFLIGFLAPSGTALAIATALAIGEGWGSIPVLVAASAAGALVGDSTGYWLGRRGADRFLHAPGWAGRVLRRYEGLTTRLFQRHSALAVTFGRPISYVRTLMPVTAGMNHMSYIRFLSFDVIGIGIWLGVYLALGAVGGEGWRWTSTHVGTGWALGGALLLIAGWLAWRFRTQTVGLE